MSALFQGIKGLIPLDKTRLDPQLQRGTIDQRSQNIAACDYANKRLVRGHDWHRSNAAFKQHSSDVSNFRIRAGDQDVLCHQLADLGTGRVRCVV